MSTDEYAITLHLTGGRDLVETVTLLGYTTLEATRRDFGASVRAVPHSGATRWVADGYGALQSALVERLGHRRCQSCAGLGYHPGSMTSPVCRTCGGTGREVCAEPVAAWTPGVGWDDED